MPSFKIEFLKALATKNNPPSSQKNNVDVRLDHFWSQWNNFDQGGASGGATAVPNPWDKHLVGKKVQNSQHFLSKVVGSDTSSVWNFCRPAFLKRHFVGKPFVAS